MRYNELEVGMKLVLTEGEIYLTEGRDYIVLNDEDNDLYVIDDDGDRHYLNDENVRKFREDFPEDVGHLRFSGGSTTSSGNHSYTIDCDDKGAESLRKLVEASEKYVKKAEKLRKIEEAEQQIAELLEYIEELRK